MRFKNKTKQNVQQDIISLIRSRFYSITFSLHCKNSVTRAAALPTGQPGWDQGWQSVPCAVLSFPVTIWGIKSGSGRAALPLLLCSPLSCSQIPGTDALFRAETTHLHSWCFVFPLSLLASWPCWWGMMVMVVMGWWSDQFLGIFSNLNDSTISWLYDQCENAPWNLRKVSWWLSCWLLGLVVRGV